MALDPKSDDFNFEFLSKRHYLKFVTKYTNYWMALFEGKIKEKKEKFGDDFYLIVVDSSSYDHMYCIPFREVSPMLGEEGFQPRQKRWILTIKYGVMDLHGTKMSIPVSNYRIALKIDDLDL